MNVITRKRLRRYAAKFATAKHSLQHWERIALKAVWASLEDMRKQFPHADQVKVKSGRIVTVFNISGNNFRLITAVHFNRKRVFILLFLTHADYSKDTWKTNL